METSKQTEPAQSDLAHAVGKAVEELVAGGAQAAEVRERIEQIIAAHVTADGHTEALSRLRSAVEIQRQAEELQHRYALEAHTSGSPWGVIGGVAGITAQSAWKRWKGQAGELDQESPLAPPAAAALDGWLTAAAMGRALGVDPRTVKAMASRGELEVSPRRSTAGRNRDLYREKQD